MIDDIDPTSMVELLRVNLIPRLIRYRSWARIRKHLGSDTQSADSHLGCSQSDGHWTNSHRLQGICYIYVKLHI